MKELEGFSNVVPKRLIYKCACDIQPYYKVWIAKVLYYSSTTSNLYNAKKVLLHALEDVQVTMLVDIVATL